MSVTASPVTDPVVSQNMKRIETNFRRMAQLVVQVPAVHAHTDNSKGLKAEIDKYEGSRAFLRETFKNLCSPVLELLEQLGNPNMDNPDFKDLTSEIETVKLTRLHHLEEAAKLAGLGSALAKEAAEEMKQVVANRQAELDETLANVREDLTKIGQGVESTIAGRMGNHQQQAERQFNVLVRQNNRSVKAIAAEKDARNFRDATANTAAACSKQQAEIQKEISRIAASEIKI